MLFSHYVETAQRSAVISLSLFPSGPWAVEFSPGIAFLVLMEAVSTKARDIVAVNVPLLASAAALPSGMAVMWHRHESGPVMTRSPGHLLRSMPEREDMLLFERK